MPVGNVVFLFRSSMGAKSDYSGESVANIATVCVINAYEPLGWI